jgi:hypothetical protein
MELVHFQDLREIKVMRMGPGWNWLTIMSSGEL